MLTAGDCLSACVIEWTLHHLGLVAYLRSAPEPPAETLTVARAALEDIAGAAFPASFSDADALRTGTGRRTPTDAQTAEPGELAARLPLVLG